MAIAPGVSGKGRANSGNTVPTNSINTQPYGSALLVGVGFGFSQIFSKIIDNKSNSFVQLGSGDTSYGGALTRYYYCENASGGPGHILTLVTTGSSSGGEIMVQEITGGALAAIIDQFAIRQDNATPFTLAAGLTTTQAAELLVTMMFGNSGSNPATHAETGLGSSTIQTGAEETNGASFITFCCATSVKSSTGTYNPSWTETGGTDSSVLLATFKEAGPSTIIVPVAPPIDLRIEAEWKPERWDFPLGSELLLDDFLPSAGGPAAYTLTAAQGTYSLSGQTAGLKATRTVVAAQGTYSLNGQVVGLKFGHVVGAGQGTYTLNGQSVNLLVTRVLLAAQGTYTLNGQVVTLTYSGAGAKVLTADFGTYTLSGQSSGIKAARNVLASPGIYTLTGITASLNLARKLVANSGLFSLVGQGVGLIYSGAVPSSAVGGEGLIIYLRRRHRRS